MGWHEKFLHSLLYLIYLSSRLIIASPCIETKTMDTLDGYRTRGRPIFMYTYVSGSDKGPGPSLNYPARLPRKEASYDMVS